MRINICHLISSLDIGGTELFLFRLLSAMDRSIFQNRVVSMIEPGWIGESIRKSGIPVNSLHLRRGQISPAGLVSLTKQIRNEKPEILTTWLYHSDLLGLIAGKLAGVRTIVWNLRSSNMDFSKYRKLSGWTVRLCSRLSPLTSAVISNSFSGKAYHEGIGYRSRIWEVIPNGIDPARFKPDPVVREQARSKLDLRPNDIAIGLVARFDPMKDHENFLAAARLVAQANESARFVLIGKGLNRQNGCLMRHLAGQPFARNVRLLDECHNMPDLLPAFDIACSSSRSEAFPNAIAESMACAVPCVATNAGDSAEIIGETGIVVPPCNSAALAAGLLRAIAWGPSKMQELGTAARERIISKFSLAQATSRYEDFFSRMANISPHGKASGGYVPGRDS